jgi:hypothetical protein
MKLCRLIFLLRRHYCCRICGFWIEAPSGSPRGTLAQESSPLLPKTFLLSQPPLRSSTLPDRSRQLSLKCMEGAWLFGLLPLLGSIRECLDLYLRRQSYLHPHLTVSLCLRYPRFSSSAVPKIRLPRCFLNLAFIHPPRGTRWTLVQAQRMGSLDALIR